MNDSRIGRQVAPGLCGDCAHARVVRSSRESTFYLCLRSVSDIRYPKYPQLPVLTCPGFEPREPAGPEGGEVPADT
ncbi:MAG TPA: hypothetical protein VD833_01930 [Vicinamibacterales bacterium]|nr:hypothetical protein [Vicinamibacterales bacterium]